MPSLASLRSLFPNLADADDKTVIELYAQDYGLDPKAAAEELGYRAPTFGSELKTALPRALGQSVQGIGQVAEDLGWDENPIKAYGQRVIERNPTQINSLGDIADYPMAALGSGTGNAAAFLGTGGALGLVGKGAKLYGAARAGQLIGGGVGQTVNAALPSYGGIREAQLAEGNDAPTDMLAAAAGAGAVGWIEQRFGLNKMLGLSSAPKQALRAEVAGMAKTPIRTAAKEWLGMGLAEGAEELVQNPIEQLAAYQDPTTAENVQETLFGGAMGALGGLGLGGYGGARAGLQHQRIRGDLRQDMFIAPDASSPTDLLQGLDRVEQYNQVEADRAAQKEFDWVPEHVYQGQEQDISQEDPEAFAFQQEQAREEKKQALRDTLAAKGVRADKIEGVVSLAFPEKKPPKVYTKEQQDAYDVLPDSLSEKHKRRAIKRLFPTETSTAAPATPYLGKVATRNLAQVDLEEAAGTLTANEAATIRSMWENSPKTQAVAHAIKRNIGDITNAKRKPKNAITPAQTVQGQPPQAQPAAAPAPASLAPTAPLPPPKPASKEELPAYKAAMIPWLTSTLTPEEFKALEVVSGVSREAAGDEEAVTSSLRVAAKTLGVSHETVRQRAAAAETKIEAQAQVAGFDLDTAHQLLGMQSSADVMDQAPVSLAQAAQSGLSVQRPERGEVAVADAASEQGGEAALVGQFGDAAEFDEGFRPEGQTAAMPEATVEADDAGFALTARDHQGHPIRPVDFEDAALEWKENVDGQDIPKQLLTQFTKLWIANEDGVLNDRTFHEQIRALRQQAGELRRVPEVAAGVEDEESAEVVGPAGTPGQPAQVATRKAPATGIPEKVAKPKKPPKAKPAAQAPLLPEIDLWEQAWDEVAAAADVSTWKALTESQRAHLMSAGSDEDLQARAVNAIVAELKKGSDVEPYENPVASTKPVEVKKKTKRITAATEVDVVNKNIDEKLDAAAHVFKVGDSVRVGSTLGVVVGVQGDQLQFRSGNATNDKAYHRVPVKSVTFVSRPNTTKGSAASKAPGKFDVRQGKLGVDMPKTIKQQGRNMYGANTADVAIKEMLQNAFDAIKAAVHQGMMKVGHIKIELDSEARTIKITDDGIGMSTDVVQDAFFTVSGTNKAGLPPEESSGGLGLAKLGILMSADRVQLTTTRDGVTTKVDAMPDEIARSDFKLTPVPAKQGEHGTVVILTIPDSYTKSNGDKADIWFPYSVDHIAATSKPLLGPVKVTVRLDDDTRVLTAGDLFDYSKFQPVKVATTDWGTMRVYFGVARKDNPKHTILSSGVYQFDHSFAFDNKKIPHDIIIDIRPSVRADDEDYPFENSRERFKQRVADDVKALSAYVVLFARGESAKQLQEGFKGVISMPRVDTNTDLAEASKKLKRAFDNRHEGEEVAAELPPVPAEVTIREGAVFDGATKVATSKPEERKKESTFNAKDKAPDLSTFMEAMKANPTQPILHNNTNVDYIAEGEKYGNPQQFLAELGTLMVEMKEELAKSGMWGYDSLAADQLFFGGISIDRGHGGVHIKVPFKAVMVNPFYDWGAKTLFGVADNLYETMTHEIAHQGDMDHGVGHNAEMLKVRQHLADSGVKTYFQDALLAILVKHESTFTVMREAYGRSTTKNTAKSLEEYGEGTAARSAGRPAINIPNAPRAVPAGRGQGGGGNIQTPAGRGNGGQGRGGPGKNVVNLDPVAFTNDTVSNMIQRVKDTAADLSQKALNAVLFLHDLIDVGVKQGLTTAKGFGDLMGEKDQIRNIHEQKIDRIMERASKLNDQPLVEKFIRDSTLEQKWGYGDKADSAFVSRFKALSSEGQQVVKDVFAVGEADYAQMQRLTNLEINEEYDALIRRFPQNTARYNKERARDIARMGRAMPKREGPYAPLKRFGDHVVVAKSQAYMDAEAAGDDKLMQKLIEDKTKPHYLVQFFETAGAAAAYAKQIQPGFTSVVAANRQQNFHKVDELPWSGIAKIKAKIEDSPDRKYKESMERLVTNLYLQMLADSSARKSEIRRKGVLGSGDMFRAFAAHGRSNAHYLAAMTKNKEIARQITAMRNEAHEAPGDVRDGATRVYNEIMARYDKSLDYKETPWVDKALRASSIWLLLSSPAYYMTNATQTYMVAMPVLGGRYGGRAFTEISKAYGDVSKFVGKMGTELDLNTLPVSAAEKTMLRDLQTKGKLDINMTSDLGRWASGAADQGIVGRTMQKLYGASAKVEALNRITTALAAYRLSGEVGYAGDMVDQTQGNYAGSNAPRFFTANGGAKLITQFRKYQLIQISLMGRLIHDGFAGASKEEKAVARRALAWLFAQQAIMTGVKGLPIPAVLYMLAAALGGDDDKDWERNLRKWIGDEDMATLLIQGIPAWMGLDVSGRIGMGNAFSVLPFSDIEFSKKGYKEAVFGASGAFVGGMGGQLADGIDKMAKGKYYKGVESLMPRGLRDAMAGYRIATEGVTTGRGDVVLSPEEISVLDGAMKAVGLPTTKYTEFQTSRGDLYELGKHFNERDTEVKDEYARAAKERDAESMTAARVAWKELQEAKTRWRSEMTRRGFGDKKLLEDIKPQPLSTLLKAPATLRKREQPWERRAQVQA